MIGRGGIKVVRDKDRMEVDVSYGIHLRVEVEVTVQ